MKGTLAQIPGFTLLGRLGKGGMAEVYLATQNSLRRKVAIKILRGMGNDAFNRRFIKEAHTLAEMQHPSIITIYDVGRLYDGRFYLAMEYVSGGDLRQFKGLVLSPAQAVDIVRQVASGLAVVHQHGLIHLDIKPGNIMFREDGGVVITDFGVARALDLENEQLRGGIAVGSPAYSSPEQAQCLALDGRSDIYSLGVTFFEMLTGQNPFRGAQHADSLLNQMQLPIPQLPASLTQYQPILQQMLAKDPEDRFDDCEALIEALDQLQVADDDLDGTLVLPTTGAMPAVLSVTPKPAVVMAAPKRAMWPWLTGALVAACVIWGAVLGGQYIYQQMQMLDWLNKAEQRLASGRWVAPEQDSATFFYQQVLQQDPHHLEALEGLKRVHQARVDSHVLAAEKRFVDGLLFKPDHDSALFHFQQALLLEPDLLAAQQGIQRLTQHFVDQAELAYGKNDFNQALAVIERGLEGLVDSPALLKLRAEHGGRQLAYEQARRKSILAAQRRAATAQTPKAASPLQVAAHESPQTPSETVSQTPKQGPIKRLWQRFFE